jgi:hypothetical protein
VGREPRKKSGVFNRGGLVIFRIGTLFWTVEILVGIYCGFWNWVVLGGVERGIVEGEGVG